MKKFGLLQELREAAHYIAGTIKSKELQPTGQWDNDLVEKELQNKGTETLACVSFSATTELEMLEKKLTGKESNYSDRFVAKMSGTTKRGNYLWKVASSIRKTGMVLEERWAYVNGWDNYYSDIPQDIKDEGLEYLDKWEVGHEWVDGNVEDIKEHLKYAPLQATVRYASGTGIMNPKGPTDHAITIYGYVEGEYWKIFDSYQGYLKKYAWDYKFDSIIKYTLTSKIKPMEIKQNHLYQLIEGKGGVALGLDDGLIIDDLAKINSTFMIRNNGDIKGKIVTATLEEWESVPHYNIKKQLI